MGSPSQRAFRILLAAALPWLVGASPSEPGSAPETVIGAETYFVPREAPRPPAVVAVQDAPNDDGRSLLLSWTLSPNDADGRILAGYRVLRSTANGPFEEIAILAPGTSGYADTGLTKGVEYTYRVVAHGEGGEAPPSDSVPIAARAQWFDRTRLATLVVMLVVCLAIWINIVRAQSGKPIYIRKIAGMDAVTEAVGRATEMGAPVLYIAGLQDMDNVQTVAGITILGSIAKLVAEYETSLLMPTSRSLVMSTARETVKEAYLAAGRPDAYREDSIYYVTDEQFGFVAHVDGVMLRRKPATCLFLGAFFAESLILAETGNSIGAIQIAGTAMPTQLPFFVAACDYTLIGEELFAASAYLSQDEKMLGSLKGQDLGKLLAMSTVAVGSLLATIASFSDVPMVATASRALQWLWSGGN